MFQVNVAEGGDGGNGGNGGNGGDGGSCGSQMDPLPVARDDEAVIPLNSAMVINVLANDYDDHPLTLEIVSTTAPGVSGATVTITEDKKNVIYKPKDGFVGIDTFQYTIEDAEGNQSTATVTVYVGPLAWVAAYDDEFSISHGSVLVATYPGVLPGYDSSSQIAGGVLANDSSSQIARGVLANDSIFKMGLIRVDLLEDVGADKGKLKLHLDGSFTYVAPDDFVGDVTFKYVVSAPILESMAQTVADALLATANVSVMLAPVPGMAGFVTVVAIVSTESVDGVPGAPVQLPGFEGNTAEVTIHVTNAKPVAHADSYYTRHDQALLVNYDGNDVKGVLANDEDPDEIDRHKMLAIQDGQAIGGTVTLDPTGAFLFVPDAGFVGTASFQYYIDDGFTTSDLVTVTIEVGNSQPQAWEDSYAMSFASGRMIVSSAAGVLRNDYDAWGDPLTAELVSNSSHGQVELLPGGGFSYVPSAGFWGEDEFWYRATDGIASTEPVRVLLTVSRQMPSLWNDEYSIVHDGLLSVMRSEGVLANDFMPADARWTAELVQGPGAGQLIGGLGVGGSFAYLPSPGFVGDDYFTYKIVCDGLEIGVATVTLHVTNSTPFAQSDWYSVAQDHVLTATRGSGVLGNDYDWDDAQRLFATLSSNPANGQLELLSDGSFLYRPNSGFFGVDSFTYQVSDGLASSTAMATIYVNPSTPDPSMPNQLTALSQSFTVSHDGVLFVAVGEGLLRQPEMQNAPDFSVTAAVVSGPTHGTLTISPRGAFVYRPNPGYVGSDGFSFRLSDGSATSNDGWISIAVADSPPSGQNDEYEIDRDIPFAVNRWNGVLTNDADPDLDALVAVLSASPQHGQLELDATGSFLYIPNAGFAGTDSFTYTVVAAGASSAPVTVTIKVRSGAAPETVTENYTIRALSPARDFRTNGPGAGLTPVDGELLAETRLIVPAGIGLLANDTDADGDRLTVEVDGASVMHGTLNWSDDGSFIYQPDAGFVGMETIRYWVSDGFDNNGDGMVDRVETYVSISVHQAPPVVQSESYYVERDTTLTVGVRRGLLSNDSDADGDRLVFELVSGPAHGTLLLGVDGSFTYTPDAGYTGIDSISYQVTDGFDGNGDGSPDQYAPATASFSVVTTLPTPILPAAQARSFSVLHNGILVVPPGLEALVPLNFTAWDDLAGAEVSSGPQHGTLSLALDGSFIYTPDENFVGTDSFTYVLTQGAQTTSPATVTITVTNSSASAHGESYSLRAGEALRIGAWNGLLANDSDLDGDELTVLEITGADVQHGALVWSAEGSFQYTPDPGFVGTETIRYRVTDGIDSNGDGVVESSQGTVTITVRDASPLAVSDAYTVGHDDVLVVSSAGGLLANDSDPDGDHLVLQVLTQPVHGTLSVYSSGGFVYVPHAGFAGSDSFTYRVADGTLNSGVATVLLSVTNGVPTVASRSYATTHDASLFVDEEDGLLRFASDPDRDYIVLSLVGGPAHGTLTLQPNGAFQYRPHAGYVGPDSFTFAVTDGVDRNGDGAADQTTAVASIQARNTAPTAAADSYTVLHDQALLVSSTYGLLANDADAERDFLTISAVSQPLYGTLALDGSGAFRYVPEAGYVGSDQFTYAVSDGLVSTAATVSIQVRNSVPAAPSYEYSILHGQILYGGDASLLEGVVEVNPILWAGDRDADGDHLTVSLVSNVSHGALQLGPSGAFSYAPDPSFVGTDVFQYAVSDGAPGGTSIGQIVIHVRNTPPYAADQIYAPGFKGPVYKNGAAFSTISSGVTSGVLEYDGDLLTAGLVKSTQHGSLTLDSATGAFFYTPEAGYSGFDGFIFQLNDGFQPSESGSPSVTALLDQWNALNWTSFTQFQYGSPPNMLTDPFGLNPVDPVLQVISDESGNVLSWYRGNLPPSYGIVIFRVANRAPTVATPGYAVLANVNPDVPAGSLTVVPVPAEPGESDLKSQVAAPITAIDPDGDQSFTFALHQEPPPEQGILSFHSDGTFTFTPTLGFIGTATFQVKASDGQSWSEPATISIRVIDPGEDSFGHGAQARDPVTFYKNEFEVRDVNARAEHSGRLGKMKQAQAPALRAAELTRIRSQWDEMVSNAAATRSAAPSLPASTDPGLQGFIASLIAAQDIRAAAREASDDAYRAAADSADSAFWESTLAADVAYRSRMRTASEAFDAAVEGILAAHHQATTSAESAYRASAAALEETFHDNATAALLAFNAQEAAALAAFEQSFADREAGFRARADELSDELDESLDGVRNTLRNVVDAAKAGYEARVTAAHESHSAALAAARADRAATLADARATLDAALAQAAADYAAGPQDAASTAEFHAQSDAAYQAAVAAARDAYDEAVGDASETYADLVAAADSALLAALLDARAAFDASVADAWDDWSAATAQARTAFAAALRGALAAHNGATSAAIQAFEAAARGAIDSYIAYLLGAGDPSSAALAAENTFRSTVEAALQALALQTTVIAGGLQQGLRQLDQTYSQSLRAATRSRDLAAIGAHQQFEQGLFGIDQTYEAAMKVARDELDTGSWDALKAFETALRGAQTSRAATLKADDLQSATSLFWDLTGHADAVRSVQADSFTAEREAFGTWAMTYADANHALVLTKINGNEKRITPEALQGMKLDFLENTARADIAYFEAVRQIQIEGAEQVGNSSLILANSAAAREAAVANRVAQVDATFAEAAADARLAHTSTRAALGETYGMASAAAARNRANAGAQASRSHQVALAGIDEQLAVTQAGLWLNWQIASANLGMATGAALRDAQALTFQTVVAASGTYQLAVVAAGIAAESARINAWSDLNTTLSTAVEQQDLQITAADALYEQTVIVAAESLSAAYSVAGLDFAGDVSAAGAIWTNEVLLAYHTFIIMENLGRHVWLVAESLADTQQRISVADARADAAARFSDAEQTHYADLIAAEAEAKADFVAADAVALRDNRAAVDASTLDFLLEDADAGTLLAASVLGAFGNAQAATAGAFADYTQGLASATANFALGVSADQQTLFETMAALSRDLSVALGEGIRDLELGLLEAAGILNTALVQAETGRLLGLSAAETAFSAERAEAGRDHQLALAHASELWSIAMAAAVREHRADLADMSVAYTAAAYAAWFAYQQTELSAAAGQTVTLAQVLAQHQKNLAQQNRDYIQALSVIQEAVQRARASSENVLSLALARINGDRQLYQIQAAVYKFLHGTPSFRLGVLSTELQAVDVKAPKSVIEKVMMAIEAVVKPIAVFVGAIIAFAIHPAVGVLFLATLWIWSFSESIKARVAQGLVGGDAIWAAFIDAFPIPVGNVAALLFNVDLGTMRPKQWEEGEKTAAVLGLLTDLFLSVFGARMGRPIYNGATAAKGRLTSLARGIRNSRLSVRDVNTTQLRNIRLDADNLRTNPKLGVDSALRHADGGATPRFLDDVDSPTSRPKNAALEADCRKMDGQCFTRGHKVIARRGRSGADRNVPALPWSEPDRLNPNAIDRSSLVLALSAVAAALVAAQLLRKRDEEEEAASAAEAAQPQSGRATEYPDPDAERDEPAGPDIGGPEVELEIKPNVVVSEAAPFEFISSFEGPGHGIGGAPLEADLFARDNEPAGSAFSSPKSASVVPDAALMDYFATSWRDDLPALLVGEPATRTDVSGEPAASAPRSASGSLPGRRVAGWTCAALSLVLLVCGPRWFSPALPEAPVLASAATESDPSGALVPIEEITTDHEVYAFDSDTGCMRWQPVEAVFRRVATHVRYVTVASASGEEQTFETTDEHPFWLPDRALFVHAGDLKPGDHLTGPQGELATIVSTRYEPHPEGVPVYNFRVAGYHTYFVQARGSRGPPVLVHNANYLIDENALIRAQAGDAVAIDFLNNNRGDLAIGKAARNEFLKGGTQAELNTLLSRFDVEFIDTADYRAVISRGSEMRHAFDGDIINPRRLKLMDSRHIAEAEQLGLRFATNDQGAFKRAIDLGVPAKYLDLHPQPTGPSKAAINAWAYTARPLPP